MTHNAVLTIPKDVLDEVNDYIENGGLPEDETIVYTVRFINGFEMDIKVCGADDEWAWTEAVLFDPNGNEVAYTEPSEEFDGEWELEDNNNNIYNVVVVV